MHAQYKERSPRKSQLTIHIHNASLSAILATRAVSV